METKEYAQKIVKNLLTLPEDKIAEVADFVHFLRKQEQHQGISLSEAGLTREEAFDLRESGTGFDILTFFRQL